MSGPADAATAPPPPSTAPPASGSTIVVTVPTIPVTTRTAPPTVPPTTPAPTSPPTSARQTTRTVSSPRVAATGTGATSPSTSVAATTSTGTTLAPSSTSVAQYVPQVVSPGSGGTSSTTVDPAQVYASLRAPASGTAKSFVGKAFSSVWFWLIVAALVLGGLGWMASMARTLAPAGAGGVSLGRDLRALRVDRTRAPDPTTTVAATVEVPGNPASDPAIDDDEPNATDLLPGSDPDHLGEPHDTTAEPEIDLDALAPEADEPAPAESDAATEPAPAD
jgi:hypothetical protein